MNNLNQTQILILVLAFSYACLTLGICMHFATRAGESILKFISQRKMKKVASATAPLQPQEQLQDETELMVEAGLKLLDLPFSYARLVLTLVFLSIPIMFCMIYFGLSIYNLGFTALVVFAAIRTLVRWQVVAAALGTGFVAGYLKSTEADVKDKSVEALGGFLALLRLIAGTFVAIWILSILSAIVPWEGHLVSFWLVLVGFSGMFLYSFAHGFKSMRFVQHTFVFGIFSAVIVMAIMPFFGINFSLINWLKGLDLKQLMTNLTPIGLPVLIAGGVYLINLKKG